MTREEFLAIANLPFYEGADAAARYDASHQTGDFHYAFVAWLAEHCQGKVAGKTSYMHFTDHLAALSILLEREPTWLEVYRSQECLHSLNIDRAWKKITIAPDGAPHNWAEANARDRKLFPLRVQYDGPTAFAIMDGRRKDPNPARTARIVADWDRLRGIETPTPIPEPEPPKPEPPKPTTKPVPAEIKEAADAVLVPGLWQATGPLGAARPQLKKKIQNLARWVQSVKGYL